MKLNSKLSQLSIFVTIGTLLILGIIFLIAINNDSITIFSDQKNSPVVKEYVTSCIELETDRAIKKLGYQGGWLYSPPLIMASRDKNEIYNQNAKGMSFLEKAEIPYWYYYDDSNKEFKFNIPDYDTNSLYSIRNQLSRYVQENLESNCLQGFEGLKETVSINYDPSDLLVDVSLKEDTIITNVNLQMEIIDKSTGTSEYLSTFKYETDNVIRVPYYLAKDITKAESVNSFIEKRIISFFTPYQDASTRDLLPPFYDFKMVYDFRPWDLTQVEGLIKQIVSSNMYRVQFLNTNYKVEQLDSRLQNNDFAKGVERIYTRDYITESTTTKEDNPKLFAEYKNYNVRPTYEIFFPSFIKISPSLGDSVLIPKPESFLGIIPFFFTEYVSVYEITMPIIFEIGSDDSDFIFNLAIESNIDHNSPLSENYDFDYEEFKSLFDEVETNGATRSLVCDPAQFISDYVYLNITDSVNYGKNNLASPKTGVSDAIINFNCKGISTCYVGATSINGRYSNNKITELKFRLPISCDPGTLEVYKYGSKKLTFENLNPTLNEPINLGEVDMPSKKKLPLEINVLNIDDSQYTSGRDISDYESGFLFFKNLDDENEVEVVEFNSDNQYDLSVSLMPGNYELQGFMFYQKNITIPAKKICYSTGIGTGQECQEIPGTNFESWVNGGIQIDSFNIETRELINAKKITVNLISTGIPASYDSLAQVSVISSSLDDLSTGKEPYFD